MISMIITQKLCIRTETVPDAESESPAPTRARQNG